MINPTNSDPFSELTEKFYTKGGMAGLVLANTLLPKNSVKKFASKEDSDTKETEFTITLDKQTHGKVNGDESALKDVVKGIELIYSKTIQGKIDNKGKITFHEGDIQGKKTIKILGVSKTVTLPLTGVEEVSSKTVKGARDVKAYMAKAWFLKKDPSSRLPLDELQLLKVQWQSEMKK